MTQDPKSLPPTASVQKAAQIMRDLDVGAIPIVDPMGQVIGIVTDRDIAARTTAAGYTGEIPIEACMTRRPEVVSSDTACEHAMHVMKVHKIRRLPVVDYGTLVGMVSLADIAKCSIAAESKATLLSEISGGARLRQPVGV